MSDEHWLVQRMFAEALRRMLTGPDSEGPPYTHRLSGGGDLSFTFTADTSVVAESTVPFDDGWWHAMASVSRVEPPPTLLMRPEDLARVPAAESDALTPAVRVETSQWLPPGVALVINPDLLDLRLAARGNGKQAALIVHTGQPPHQPQRPESTMARARHVHRTYARTRRARRNGRR